MKSRNIVLLDNFPLALEFLRRSGQQPLMSRYRCRTTTVVAAKAARGTIAATTRTPTTAMDARTDRVNSVLYEGATRIGAKLMLDRPRPIIEVKSAADDF
jgi:hypothetical protein